MVVAAACAQASAQLLYEPFNYGTAAETGSAANYQVGLLTNGGPTTVWDTTDSFAPGASVFVVGSYIINANITGTGNALDVNQLWINPSSASFGAGTAPAPTLSMTGGGISTSV